MLEYDQMSDYLVPRLPVKSLLSERLEVKLLHKYIRAAIDPFVGMAETNSFDRKIISILSMHLYLIFLFLIASVFFVSFF